MQESVDGVCDVAEAGRPGDGVPGDAVAPHGGGGDGGHRVGGADERGVGGDLDEAARADEDGAELEQRVPLPRALRDGRLHIKEGDLGPTGGRSRGTVARLGRRQCRGRLRRRGHGGRRRHFCREMVRPGEAEEINSRTRLGLAWGEGRRWKEA